MIFLKCEMLGLLQGIILLQYDLIIRVVFERFGQALGGILNAGSLRTLDFDGNMLSREETAIADETDEYDCDNFHPHLLLLVVFIGCFQDRIDLG